MNEFVEECRSEWKRLGVADDDADEMAAELAADLEEAAAEGAAPQDVVGALDAQAFAAAWAAERGVVRRQRRGLRTALLAAATAAFALAAVAGALVVLLASPGEPRRLSLAAPARSAALWMPAALTPAPGRVLVRVVSPNRRIVFSPDGRQIAVLGAPRSVPVVVDLDDSGFDARILGAALLGVGLTGMVLLTMFWRVRAAA